MDNNYNYSLYRINTLLTLFRSEYAIYSISELSQMLEVPKSVIREDIYILCKGVDECETIIFSYDEDETSEDDFLDRLKSGLEDDTPLGAYSRFKADIFLPLDRKELDVLDSFYPDEQFGIKFSQGGVYTKVSPYREDTSTLVKISELNEHIMAGRSLLVKYPAKTGNLVDLTFKPLCIVRYNLEDISYAVSIKAGHIFPLRIDKIESMEVLNKDIQIRDFSPLKKLPLMWKMDIGEAVDVKIKIIAPKRIRDKIKNGIFNMRVTYESIASSELKELIEFEEENLGSWLDIDDNCSEFSGQIYGITAFKNWVNGYGCSIVVEKPQSLRDEIVENAKIRYNNYLK